MPKLSVNTASLPDREQFGAWRDLNRSAIDLSLTEGMSQPFAASMDVWDLGRLVYTYARLPDGVQREWTHWRHRPLDHWCLVILEPQQTPIRPRIIGFRSLAGAFTGAAADSDVHTLYIPRALFGGGAGTLDRVPADIPDTGLGALLADHLLNVYRRLPEITAAELPRLVEAVRVMILACAMPSRDHLHAARNVIGETMLERARQLIEQNLLSPDLGVDMLGGRLGLSRSHLYRLFENDGGVQRFIRRRRLQNAHTVLSSNDPSSLQAIGEARGFQDAASFSRAFRQEFGYAPGEARQISRTRGAVLNRSDSGKYQSLNALLQAL